MIKREWTPGRVAGWLMVFVGAAAVIWSEVTLSHMRAGAVGLLLIWSGAWFLFWSWVLWRIRRRRIFAGANRG